MPSLTYREARSEILDRLISVWTDEIRYEDVSDVTQLPNGVWCRPSVRHATGEQASLSGGTGTKRWQRNGILTVQIFTPVGDGLSRAYDLAKIVGDAYEGYASPGGVWFRNLRVNEIGDSGKYSQANVIVEFEYDEIK